MRLSLETCIIRPWTLDDVESLVYHANDERVWEQLRDRFPHPYGEGDAREWISLAMSADPVTDFAIEAEGKAVGGIGFAKGSDVYRRGAEIGYWLGHDFWGKGIASEALRELTDHVFAMNPWLVRLFASVFAENKASAKVLERAGYAFEARHRLAVVKKSRLMDELIYVRLREASRVTREVPMPPPR